MYSIEIAREEEKKTGWIPYGREDITEKAPTKLDQWNIPSKSNENSKLWPNFS